jgi:hypothetical protein
MPPEGDLLVIDGPLRGRQHLPRALGYIKSHHSTYLPPELNALVGTLRPGQEVLIHLTVRRFVCGNDACRRRTFAEQVSSLAARHARRTAGLGETLAAVALALGAGRRPPEQQAGIAGQSVDAAARDPRPA